MNSASCLLRLVRDFSGLVIVTSRFRLLRTGCIVSYKERKRGLPAEGLTRLYTYKNISSLRGEYIINYDRYTAVIRKYRKVS